MTEQEKREKVIKGLQCCDGFCDWETGCPYYDELEPFDCQEQLREDALALLKAQGPREPIMRRVVFEYDTFSEAENKMYCPKCKMELLNRVNYCPKCGQAVKWDG